MPAEANLAELLRNMNPTLQPGTYCYCRWSNELPPGFWILGSFREAERWTLILEESVALQHGLMPVFRSAWISLNVHSDLQAVGFMAEISRSLADAGIACNVVSAIDHDHLFVPVARGVEALQILESLQSRASERVR